MIEPPLWSRDAAARRGRNRLSDAIQHELTERLFDAQNVTMAGAVGVLLQGVLCYTQHASPWLIWWSITSFVVMIACVLQEYAFRHRCNPKSPSTAWQRWYAVAACVNGGSFGIGGAAALGGIDDGFLRMVLFGAWNAYVMAAALRNAYFPLAVRCYVGCAALPLFAVTVWRHDIAHGVYFILILMFVGTALSVADKLYVQTVQFLQVDEERIKLVDAAAHTNQDLATANEQLAALARIDGLTGIPNRRALDERLTNIVAAAQRDGFPVSLLMCDIDWFKKYNDHYGHQAGDECLRRVAQILQGCLHRPTDLLARYGGEEFLAVLPDTDENGLALVGEHMRRTVEDLALMSKASPHGVVTVSIGAATGPPEISWTSEKLVSNADVALYAAKNNGRNQVVHYGSEVPVAHPG